MAEPKSLPDVHCPEDHESDAAESPARIVVLNAGSSSIKFATYDVGQFDAALFRGEIEKIGLAADLRVINPRREVLAGRAWPTGSLDQNAATRQILSTIWELIQERAVSRAGHRVVHGGAHYAAPVRIDAGVLASLEELVSLDPLHQPSNLAPIHTIAEAAPQMPQVACFDIAFHRGQPHFAQIFPLLHKLTDAGIRRYGLHGLSCEYIASRLPVVAPEIAAARVIIAHLGNGAGLCALRAGRSAATTMGFTAADGLMMGTRCGSIDPGVLLYLMDKYKMGAPELADLIYRHSGLLGVSGISSDMRTLRTSGDSAAAEAIALFVYRIVRETGSLAAALGGLDAFVFTAGIGENDATTRAEVLAGCRWLGLVLDDARNRQGSLRISADAATASASVIPTDEEQMIARHTAAVLASGAPPPQ